MSDPANNDDSSFPTTQWSLVHRVGRGGIESQEALATLLNRYLPALRSHLMVRQGIAPQMAEDLLQGFLVDKIVEKQLIGKADRKRGRFRSFLLVSLDRYVIDQIRRMRADKRRGTEADSGGDELLQIPSSAGEPDRAFDLAWAREILAQAEQRMQLECRNSGRDDLWDIFRGRIWLPAIDGTEPVDYQTLVQKHGFRSPLEASNVMITAKRAFARHLRAIVFEYTGDESETEAEIHDLFKIVSHR